MSEEFDNSFLQEKSKIISAAYGDASLKERFEVWLLMRKNPELRQLFIEHKKTAASVHKIKLDKCPDDLVKKAFKAVSNEADYRAGKTFSSNLFGNPIFAGITAVILLAAVLITFNIKKQGKEIQYSKQEIVEAEVQAKQSLEFISKILNQTQRKIEYEILPEKVSKPIKQGFEIINQLFPKGEKSNENS